MGTSRRASGYDLFKLAVAILLLILFLLLSGRRLPQSPTPISTLTTVATLSGNTNAVGFPVASTALLRTSTSTVPPSPAETHAGVATQTPRPSPTAATAPAETIPSLPSPTTTSAAATTQTPLPLPTTTNVPEPIVTPLPTSIAAPSAATPVASVCEAASSRSRLQSGMKATILRRLNFRSSPGIEDNWLRTNIPGTQVQIVGGPECIPHIAGAYVWWQIKLPDGQTGWSAEGSQFGSFYFMEPIQ